MEIRNQIVHFKAISVPAIVNEVPIRKRIQDFGLEKIMQIPDDLSEILDDALQNVLKEMPDYELVMKATKLFED